MDMDTIALTYLLHRTQPPLAEICTLEMDRTQSVGEFLALAASFSSKYLRDVGEMRVYKPRIPISTFQQFTTLISSLPQQLDSVAYPLENENSIEKDLPEFHHYVIIDVSPCSSHSQSPSTSTSHLHSCSLSGNHLPSPPPSPRPETHNIYTPDTPLQTVLSHPLFESEGLSDFPGGKQLPITLSHPAFGVFSDVAEGVEVGEQEGVFVAALCGALRRGVGLDEVRKMLEEWLGVTFELGCRSTGSWTSSRSTSPDIILTHSSPASAHLPHAHLALNALLRTSVPSAVPQSAMHIHLSGPYISFAGLTWNSFEVVYEPMTGLPLVYGVQLARAVKALREFLRILQETRRSDVRSLEVPYPLFLGKDMGVEIDTSKIETPFPGRLLFFAPSSSSSSRKGDLCINLHGHTLRLHMRFSLGAATRRSCMTQGGLRVVGGSLLCGGWASGVAGSHFPCSWGRTMRTRNERELSRGEREDGRGEEHYEQKVVEEARDESSRCAQGDARGWLGAW
ncbi:hypothetical protein BDQ17DRAFT_744598 [Cyathus striatus]|nr:hypothetical protein BDQ17DRAFT_744598 [Cyathus striatus]